MDRPSRRGPRDPRGPRGPYGPHGSRNPRDPRGPRDPYAPRGQRDRRQGRPPRPSADERLSRFLAFVLRHHPEEAGLELDDRGSADLDAVVEAMHARPGLETVTRDKVERLAATDEGAARFEIQGDRIRARYGHSLTQAIQCEPGDPPADLFHGTTPESAEQILAEGLKPGDRQRVHLSVDTPSAREVGRRHCTDPVILRIDTAGAAKAGVRFYPAAPTVWLSDEIPPECIFRAD